MSLLCFWELYPSLSYLDAHANVCFIRESEWGVITLWFSSQTWSSALNFLTLAPLHTGLDQGKWPFNRHDSLFDWELCPTATSLSASKASQRLCSASSPSPRHSLFLYLFIYFVAMLLLWCLQSPRHPETSLLYPSVMQAPPHPLLLTALLLIKKSCTRGHDFWETTLVVRWSLHSIHRFVCRGC